MYFSCARAVDRDFCKLIRQPSEKRCRLCGLTFHEDSSPVPLIERMGIDEIDFCAPCLTNTLFQDGAREASKELVHNYLRNLTETLSRVPPSDFGRNIGDLHGMSSDERLAVFRVLQNKPSLKRVKELYGSWLNALIKSGVLEDDVRRTSR